MAPFFWVKDMDSSLILKTGQRWRGVSFGANTSIAGEVVFATGMVGYPESLTDPSYAGQILVLTFPLIGNYGVSDALLWESDKIHVSGLIVSSYIDEPSHVSSVRHLNSWLRAENIPALEIVDTRLIALTLRDQGATLGKIVIDRDVDFVDPNESNLVDQVSTKQVMVEGSGNKTVILIDCGVKLQIRRELLKRGVRVITVPWNYDLAQSTFSYDGVVVSNGPGDPKRVTETILSIKHLLSKKLPFMGICLGHQLLALAAGGDTYKLKFGHRSQNQPCVLVGTERCFLTTQNHGYAVGKIPEGFKPWFTNVHDQSNEGIRHKQLPFFSVQFHPEAQPGPVDTKFIFDEFIESIRK
jgi:carbamoyl-phosphate synthase small subunit